MHYLLCVINHKNVIIKATQGFGGVNTAKISKYCNKKQHAQGFGGSKYSKNIKILVELLTI